MKKKKEPKQKTATKQKVACSGCRSASSTVNHCIGKNATKNKKCSGYLNFFQPHLKSRKKKNLGRDRNGRSRRNG